MRRFLRRLWGRITKAGSPTPREANRPETCCVLPWKHLQINSGGEVRLCPPYRCALVEGGEPLTVRRHSLDEIWNSQEMRRIRQAMVEGQPLPGCQMCYQEEAASGSSQRVLHNEAWEKGWLSERVKGGMNERRVPLRVLQEEAVATGFRVATAPHSLELNFGNLCNLKCRMCNGTWSSRIGADPVHGKWVYPGAPSYGAHSWVAQEGAIERLLQHPEQIRFLKLMGGETLVVKEVGYVLQRLIDAGAAPAISLEIVTNATTTKTPWLGLTAHFAGVAFNVSIDGLGKHFEYIRYPARWDALLKNVAVFKGLPRATVSVTVTLQSYNALHLADLLRFLDAAGIPSHVNPLFSPAYLRASILPARARKLAAQRLRTYAERDCRLDARERVRALADSLDPGDHPPDAELLRQFMLFTNDLDQSRGQDLRATDPELVQLLAEDGFPWVPETLHAPAP